METIKLKINGVEVTAPVGSTVLEAARLASIEIPTLCYLKDLNEIGACRICMVEVKGMRNMVASCVFPASEGMEVYTNTKKVFNARKMNLELLLSNHNRSCLTCVRSGNCELQTLCHDFDVQRSDSFDGAKTPSEIDNSAEHMYRDNSKCILCRRCVAACSKWQSVSVIGANDRGFNTHIGCAFEQGLGEIACVSCGQCIVVCPTGALSEKDHTDKAWEALADPEKTVIVQTAPSIRATLGEEFGDPIGTEVSGKLAAALRRVGFHKVFDTDFSADLTITEEANEFISRVKNGGKLPLITSCSPGWIKFCEHNFPDFLENLSSCKSPQQMFGAIIKTWYAQKNNLDPKNIVVVSVMPCTAKKFEMGRDDQAAAGVPDVDIVLTTREIARMIKRAGIDWNSLPDEKFDDPLGDATGAGHIFGATGGVMEAALRTAVETLTGKTLDKIDFEEVRGTEGIKEAEFAVGDLNVKVAVVSGLSNARELLEAIRKGEKDYHFIEVMACPGGCVNGGGQPIQTGTTRSFVDLKAIRAKALYDLDASLELRKSHESPTIKMLYEEFLEKPGSHKAHDILHTHYVARSRF